MKVLIVEDDLNELKSLSLALRSAGFSILESQSAQQALEYLNKGEPVDLVLTDYMMPHMDGIELLYEIRRKSPELPVIIMTAYADKDVAIRALHCKCNGFLEKPFTLRDLQKEIGRVTLSAMKETNSSWVPTLIPKIVHQINNPLMAITGACELGMLEPDNPDTTRRCFEGILEATGKIDEINRNMLGLGRSALPTREMSTELHRVMEKCLDSFFGLIALRGIEVYKEYVDREVTVRASQFALDQVFKNLIMNAIEALEQRKYKRITLKTELYERGYVSAWIHDTGSGIPGDMIPMIFKPFVTNKASGNGLGLAVVKEIVDGISGKIEVKSQEGEGTVFRIDLPVKEILTKEVQYGQYT